MTIISSFEGFATLATFGIAMIGLVYFLSRKKLQSLDLFLVAERRVNWLSGALSIAATWLWAPAIFIVSMQAYTKGLAGVFWFVVPNIVCFFVFAPLAIQLRTLMPQGYTLPEFILKRFNNDKRVHLAYLFIFFGYQLGAIIINSLAGGILLSTLSGLNFYLAVILLSAIALGYSLISGLDASILTDVFQMGFILISCFVLVPLVIFYSGWSSITAGLGGVTGEFSSIFNPWIAFTLGIPMTLSLLSGPIGDQMFFQRAFASKKEHMVKTFVVGGLLFGIVPIMISLLGFIAAGSQLTLSIADPQMVGPLMIAYFLPKAALIVFIFMAFSGLCSTIDSAYCAISSLGTIDVYQQYINKNADHNLLLIVARIVMIIMAVLGTTIALLQPKLLWVFLIYGALASAGCLPTVFSLYWKRYTSNAAFWSVVLSLLVGLPLSIYANIVENPVLIVVSALASVGVGLVVSLCCGFRIITKKQQSRLSNE